MKRINYRKRDGQRLTISEYKKRRKFEIISRITLFCLSLIFVIVLIVSATIHSKVKSKAEDEPSDNIDIMESNEASSEASVIEIIDTIVEEPDEYSPYKEKSDDASSFFDGYTVEVSENTDYIASEDVLSTYALLVNLDDGTAVASKDGTVRINPASMTKILTLLVAAEHITDIDDTFEMTQAIGDFVYKHDCSAVGFEVGEKVTVQDLLYGTILPSGGDAAMCLAEYVAGSQEAFVDMMNDKLSELGLSNTAHFTNCIGIYDEDHYCTLMDMAMILKAAEENKLCHEVLQARVYTTSNTVEHPEGITISNWFIRRIEDKDTHGEVCGAKTGFVVQSGCCGASYQISNDGTHYICVTADAWSSWRCIYDHVAIYDAYTS
ncbi:MAG: D-alanyl-D-alanine carboxypeptidase [Butyrivibrio sp.]|uniref:D-alanyl-D-alanine carboxypeptidase family protein n=1 Tax=Butyrivibrio sp. TaxID=28121 RepID=UPI0025BFE81A|nr:serine hydrolase [Butyrivibrio sp.]MBQ6587900.1 D-alanyl-D-alanine carboxypeptidase [Butyrivibrio sp.]